MRNLSKRLPLALLLFTMIFSIPTYTAFASTTNGEQESATTDTEETVYICGEALGVLTPEELLYYQNKANEYCTTCIVPMHFSFTAHTHTVTAITSTYSSRRDQGIVASTPKLSHARTLSFSKSYTLSNTWSTTHSFAADTVTAAVGFSVTASTTSTASYSLPVPANKGGEIRLYHVFNVKNFNTMTSYHSEQPPYFTNEYGTGSAEQFSHYEYTSRLF